MRAAALVSESAQWQTTSCADHSPGAGRHFRAPSGTLARACLKRDGPSAYCSIRRSRSSRVMGSNACLTLKGGGEVGLPHEIEIDAAGGAPALGDGPDDQRLAALHVTGGEDSADARHPVLIPPDVSPLCQPAPPLLHA